MRLERTPLNNYTVKRGEGLSCNGKAYDHPKSEWVFWPIYVPNGCEVYLGEKEFLGELFGVFQCLDDSFYAQPVDILKLPIPKDPMKEVSILPKQYRQYSESFNQGEALMLTFKGTNWKLVGDKKWKEISLDVNLSSLELLGTKTIKGEEHNIYRHDSSFLAVKKA